MYVYLVDLKILFWYLVFIINVNKKFWFIYVLYRNLNIGIFNYLGK